MVSISFGGDIDGEAVTQTRCRKVTELGRDDTSIINSGFGQWDYFLGVVKDPVVGRSIKDR